MKTIAFLALLLIVLAIPVGCAKQEETTEFHNVITEVNRIGLIRHLADK